MQTINEVLNDFIKRFREHPNNVTITPQGYFIDMMINEIEYLRKENNRLKYSFKKREEIIIKYPR